ncbi:DUF4179 domain-containing protein [Acetatifactor aquisgranensis]|uniref:DUF4179 domain-containing protein n=1 Tax=Acetatifactor aquisgranensis TaxID=2941233 RepID=UPI00203B14C1|nr:DUF4179 domain-containing protein [Acetatifactor aquisgranensis]
MTENKIWEEMEVPQELDRIILEAVGEGHRKLVQKRNRKHRRAAAISMATAAACFIAVAIGFTNPVVARAYSNIPVLGNIFAYLYDTADSGIPYAQIGDAAVPVKGQDEVAWEDSGQKEPKQEESAQEEPGQQGGAVPEEEADTENPVQIAIKEYFCDRYSLYLSFEVVSEEPFMEGVPDMTGKEGSIFLYATESIAIDAGEHYEIGNGSLIIKGIFTDAHTFVGIGRSGDSLGEYPVADGMVYEMDSAYMRVFTEEMETDIRGEWKASAEITCTEESLMTESLEQAIRGDCALKEVRVQPYEIQAVIEEPKGTSLAGEYVVIEAFDDKGRRLAPASSTYNRFVEDGENSQEVWMFEKPADAQKVTVFAVDELKWMDEWKGYLYCDEPWSGEQMVEFLKENSFAYGEVELP